MTAENQFTQGAAIIGFWLLPTAIKCFGAAISYCMTGAESRFLELKEKPIPSDPSSKAGSYQLILRRRPVI
jgi:hypothetical protein